VYCCGDNWRALCEYDVSGTFKRWFAYGIDEVLMVGTSRLTLRLPMRFAYIEFAGKNLHQPTGGRTA